MAMSKSPLSLATDPVDYAHWLQELKTQINSAQQLATLPVNRVLVLRCWKIRREILAKEVE